MRPEGLETRLEFALLNRNTTKSVTPYGSW